MKIMSEAQTSLLIQLMVLMIDSVFLIEKSCV